MQRTQGEPKGSSRTKVSSLVNSREVLASPKIYSGLEISKDQQLPFTIAIHLRLSQAVRQARTARPALLVPPICRQREVYTTRKPTWKSRSPLVPRRRNDGENRFSLSRAGEVGGR